jgi:hypothetical protein
VAVGEILVKRKKSNKYTGSFFTYTSTGIMKEIRNIYKFTANHSESLLNIKKNNGIKFRCVFREVCTSKCGDALKSLIHAQLYL